MNDLDTRPIRQVEDYHCPHCKVSLRGSEITKESQHLFGATHFGREIGIEVWGVYDGALYYKCPDCGGKWHRWKPGSWQYAKAIAYVNA